MSAIVQFSLEFVAFIAVAIAVAAGARSYFKDRALKSQKSCAPADKTDANLTSRRDFMKLAAFGTGAATLVMLGYLSGRSAYAAFADTQSSTGNTSTAWTSLLWTQTSQADFTSGDANNVDLTTSPGDVKLPIAASGNMILFWDGGALPAGWTDVSAAGQPFNNMFPRGNDTYGGTGGATTHTHPVNLISMTGPSATTGATASTTANVSSGTHTHSLAAGSTTAPANVNLPSYRSLRVMQYAAGIPTSIPAGAIAMFDAALPVGWTQYSAENNYFVRGANTVATGGSNTHSPHSFTNGLLANTLLQGVATPTPRTGVATSGHTHTTSGTTDFPDNRPPFITTIFAKTSALTAIPAGMIAMFTATPGGAWNVLSGVGGPFYQKFLQGSATYGTTGGSATHPHANTTFTSGSNAGGTTNATNGAVLTGKNTHTHSVTVSFGPASASELPPYIDVIIAKLGASLTGTLASAVKDTNVSACRWDSLAWTATTPAGTTLTIEVRASDTPFLLTDASPSWTAVGGTSPVTSGLPAGRYKQWRTTLATTRTEARR